MSTKTKIAWCDSTWNVVTGCTKISAGCRNCYVERLWPRLSGNKATRYHERRFGEVECHSEELSKPLRWRTPERIMVPSMGDLFHPSVPDSFIASVFGVMAACPQHTFMVLTKRPLRAKQWMGRMGQPFLYGKTVFPSDTDGWRRASCLLSEARRHVDVPQSATFIADQGWPLPNVWLGVSCENQWVADDRIPILLDTPAAKRFVSLEPLLGPVDLGRYASYPDWAIVGGESGPKARPCDRAWIRDIVSQCKARVPCFVKQLGAFSLCHDDRCPTVKSRSGSDPSEWPEYFRVQEMPE